MRTAYSRVDVWHSRTVEQWKKFVFRVSIRVKCKFRGTGRLRSTAFQHWALNSIWWVGKYNVLLNDNTRPTETQLIEKPISSLSVGQGNLPKYTSTVQSFCNTVRKNT